MAKGKRTTVAFDPVKVQEALEEAFEKKSYKSEKKADLLLPFKTLIQKMADDGATVAKIAAILKNSGGYSGSAVSVTDFCKAHIKFPAAAAATPAPAPAPAPVEDKKAATPPKK